MLYPLRDRLLAAAFALVAAVPAAAENLRDMTGALNAAAGRDWPAARQAAAASGPVALSLIDWQRLRAGQGTWAEYRDFAATRRDWPGMDLFWRRGDAVLRPDLPAPEVLAWFGDRKPDTMNGFRALLAALNATDPKAADAELARFWTTQAISEEDERVVLTEYGVKLAPLHDARLTNLLDQGEWAAAERMIPLASPDVAAVARARVAMQAGRTGVDALILGMPAALQADPGLVLDRFRWRVRAKMHDPARDLMLAQSTSAEALRDPAAWASMRVDYARAALRAGDWDRAERFAANHFLDAGHRNYTDLEWLAGYAALRAGAPDRAIPHFRKLESSGSPITLSRAHYWLGRAHEAAGDAPGATGAYQRAAAFQTAFYGQLAAERIGAVMSPDLAITGLAADTLPDWRGSALTESPLWQAAVWQIAAGYPDQGQRFFLHMAETAPHDDIARMARLMLELRMPWHAVRLAKAAASKGGIYPAAYYPLTGLEHDDHVVPNELVMSIARQESEFNFGVSSPAGAKGLMQVMPETARMMANRLGEPYEFARLTTDPDYNARLGAAYLRGLYDRFGTSTALVASGYNAGPGRPARWLGDFGDLRRHADPVDWVEMIPFDETRNYVMRVTEAMPIYRARITGKPAPIVPTFELTGGGLMPPPPPPPIRLAASARPPRALAPLIAAASGGILRAVIPPMVTEARADPAPLQITPAGASGALSTR